MKPVKKPRDLLNFITNVKILNPPHEQPKDDEPPDGPATFEQAISATGFGKFNIVLMTIIAIPSAWATMMATTTTSYIIPVAQCDLDLSLQDKGLLNGITYLGMISSGFMWGFLADTLGRKKLLVIGYFLDGFFVMLSGSSQNYYLVLFSKYMNGCIINGPFAVITTSLSEFHNAKYRARILMLMGLLYSSANTILPLLGWLILPVNINIEWFDGAIVWHSWNVFLMVCALPSVLAATVHIFLPESPKFLMTVGKNDKAMEVFKKIYSWNSGKDPECYPVKILIDENLERKLHGSKHGGVVTANRTKVQALKEGWQQITPLFFPPHGVRLLLVCTIQFGVMMGLNTIRLWLPQIFTAINDYNMRYHKDASLCIMLDSVQPKNQTIECVVNTSNDAVYVNAFIVAIVSMGAYLIAGASINFLGKKKIFLIFGLLSGTIIFGLYASTNSSMAIATSSLFVAFLGVCTNMMLTVVVDLFPTSLRTMTVSFVMMSGRLGAMMGNLVFPYLLEMGCLPPFTTIGCVVLFSILLTTVLPSTDMKALE